MTHRGNTSVLVRFVALALAIATSALAATPASDPPTDLKVRAAFLLNFAAFVEWPPSAFSSNQAPIVLGIYGVDPFGDFLEKLVEGETARGRPFVVRRYPAGTNPAGSHILFIADSERRSFAAVLERIRGQPVLTVSNLDGFNEKGGVIQLVAERGRIRFQINQLAAQKVGLVLSSKLLRLGRNPGS